MTRYSILSLRNLALSCSTSLLTRRNLAEAAVSMAAAWTIVGVMEAVGSAFACRFGSLQLAVTTLIISLTVTVGLVSLRVKRVMLFVVVTLFGVTVVVGFNVVEGFVTVTGGSVETTVSVVVAVMSGKREPRNFIVLAGWIDFYLLTTGVVVTVAVTVVYC